VGAGALEKLIEKRLKSGAGKSRVDEQIWNLFGERWAIMFTDLSGFSRRVADFGIIHFLQTIYESNRLLVPIIEEYSGILLKVKGDSLLVIFRSVDEAIECAVAMQRCAKEYKPQVCRERTGAVMRRARLRRRAAYWRQ
jgi:adenylate cyclase